MKFDFLHPLKHMSYCIALRGDQREPTVKDDHLCNGILYAIDLWWTCLAIPSSFLIKQTEICDEMGSGWV